VALVDLTKQLAGQALGNVLNPPAPQATENTGATIVGQIQAMQKALKDDDELIVSTSAAGETIRVTEFYLPSWTVAVLKGLDAHKNLTRVVAPIETLQLVCRVVKAAAGVKANRISFVLPKN
jgi:hypothetical protein